MSIISKVSLLPFLISPSCLFLSFSPVFPGVQHFGKMGSHHTSRLHTSQVAVSESKVWWSCSRGRVQERQTVFP